MSIFCRISNSAEVKRDVAILRKSRSAVDLLSSLPHSCLNSSTELTDVFSFLRMGLHLASNLACAFRIRAASGEEGGSLEVQTSSLLSTEGDWCPVFSPGFNRFVLPRPFPWLERPLDLPLPKTLLPVVPLALAGDSGSLLVATSDSMAVAPRKLINSEAASYFFH